MSNPLRFVSKDWVIGEEPLIHPPVDPAVARGDLLLDDEEDGGQVKSQLPGVSDECWTQFVRGMITADADSVSPSNALGMFELMPRRLADLQIVAKLARAKGPSGRTVWVAVFIPPLTSDKFLKSPEAQYKVFTKSTQDYAKRVNSGEIEKDDDMSLSGALAILHRCGPSGLKTWSSGLRFPATEATYDRVAGVF